MQVTLNDLKQILEYDDREYPMWHGHIGHFSVDGDTVVISRSWADPKEGCNSQKLYLDPAKNGSVALRGFDIVGKPIKIDQEIDMQTALQRILAGAQSGHRNVEEFVRDVVPIEFDY